MASQDSKPENKNADIKKEAEQLARLLYRIYKDDYPKIKLRRKQT
jgi:hypothetical protein